MAFKELAAGKKVNSGYVRRGDGESKGAKFIIKYRIIIPKSLLTGIKFVISFKHAITSLQT